jgi:hypothetical protein
MALSLAQFRNLFSKCVLPLLQVCTFAMVLVMEWSDIVCTLCPISECADIGLKGLSIEICLAESRIN